MNPNSPETEWNKNGQEAVQTPAPFNAEQHDGSREVVQDDSKMVLPPLDPSLVNSQPILPVQQLDSTQASAAPSQPIGANPTSIAAADVDNIEKEWIRRARYIIDLTKSNPHQQEIEVSKLKEEYKSKRFGRAKKIETK